MSPSFYENEELLADIYLQVGQLIVSVVLSVSGLILGLHPASERRRYNGTPSLIGWGQT